MTRTNVIVIALSVSLAAGLTGYSLAQDAEGAAQVITRAGSQPSIEGPAEYFTGNASIDPVFPSNSTARYSGAYVTFEPGARSAWHLHPAGQHIIVTSGTGRTGVWDGPVEEIREGDVVWCPPGVKHWHGAAPASAMTHLVITGYADGRNVEWREKVTEKQYQLGEVAVHEQQDQ